MNSRLLVLLSLLSPAAGLAQISDVPAGYRTTASDHHLSPAIFYAIALTESGQSRMTAGYRPWPWTLSIDGEPFFFASRVEARTALLKALQRQPRQLGIGLFQVEFRFHFERFDSAEEMLDPYENSRVAAEIFSESLATTKGNVWQAIGLFHSATPDLAEAYRKRVARRLVGLVGSTGYGG